jgi:hypothetical protein
MAPPQGFVCNIARWTFLYGSELKLSSIYVDCQLAALLEVTDWYTLLNVKLMLSDITYDGFLFLCSQGFTRVIFQSSGNDQSIDRSGVPFVRISGRSFVDSSSCCERSLSKFLRSYLWKRSSLSYFPFY